MSNLDNINNTQLKSLLRKTIDVLFKELLKGKTDFVKSIVRLAITNNKIRNVEEVLNGVTH